MFDQKEYASAFVLETLAREMMKADPELAGAFEARVGRDREFAGDARARSRLGSVAPNRAR